MFNSPLRYPGGKNKLAAFIAKICCDNGIDGHYVEPYAGGASVALFLLLEGFVRHITINDKDRSIYAFWYSVLNYENDLCRMIEETPITIEEWRRQKNIQRNKDSVELLELGFSTLFLNRTNRSGIITAGPIGGVEQNGDYKLDCRFNKAEIVRRIKKIACRRSDISLFNIDALLLIELVEREKLDNNVIFYFDPPYYHKADSLYLNFYNYKNHKEVSERILNIQGINWIVSYDNVHEIRKLYGTSLKKEYSFKHTAYEQREGKEILYFSKNLQIPTSRNYNPINYKFKRKEEKSIILYKE